MVSGTDVKVADYAYDALGRRAEKTVTAGNITTRYLWGGSTTYAELSGTGVMQRQYVYGPGIDEPLMVREADGSKNYVHRDGKNTVVAVSGTSGVSHIFTMDVFGHGSDAAISPYKFTSRRLDDETGNYYYRNRYYHPKQGRFMSNDPIGYADGLNMYAYAANDPVNFSDPMGTCGTRIRDGIAANCSWIDYSGSSGAGTSMSEQQVINRIIQDGGSVDENGNISGTFTSTSWTGGMLLSLNGYVDLGPEFIGDGPGLAGVGNYGQGGGHYGTDHTVTQAHRLPRTNSGALLTRAGLLHLTSRTVSGSAIGARSECVAKLAPNGCGSGTTEGLVPENPFECPFANACSRHDIGYGTFGRSKAAIDQQFREDMYNAADRAFPLIRINPITGVEEFNPSFWRANFCKTLANLYYFAVSSAGQSAYNSAQRTAAQRPGRPKRAVSGDK